MSDSVRINLRLALRKMLKPLVKLLINQGVTHADFADAAKDVYVEVAIRHFMPGEKINQSRIAVLTGLTRKEVKNVLLRATGMEVQGKNFSRPSKVLMGWFSDPRFVGPYGMPLELPYEDVADGRPSFKELVRTFGSDMAPKQMYEVLLNSGAISEPEPGVVKAVHRSFEPTGLSPQLIERFGDVAQNFFTTAAGNIEKRTQGDALLERVVSSERNWSADELVALTEYTKKHGQALLENIDNWIVRQGDGSPKEPVIETGLGIYHYVESREDKSSLKELLAERGMEFEEVDSQ